MADMNTQVMESFGKCTALSEDVLEVHREHLQKHPYVNRYDSAGEYFEEEVGISDVADGYYDKPIYSVFRLHSFAPRDYLLVQKNPNLPTSWIKEGTHWSYEDLAGDLGKSLQMNILQSAKTISGYFNNTDTVRVGLKCIIDAVQTELGCEFSGNALRQSDYEKYLQLAEARSYRNGREGTGAGLNEGFHRDFAYTNRCKFQDSGSSAKSLVADDEWLEDELKVISPKVVFALGGDAYRGLQNVGFKKVGERSRYSDGKTGRVLRYEGDVPNLHGTYAVHLYHLDYRQTLTTDRDVHDALKTVAQMSDKDSL